MQVLLNLLGSRWTDANATYLQNVTLAHVTHSVKQAVLTRYAVLMKWVLLAVHAMLLRSVIRHRVKVQQTTVYVTQIVSD
jgi:hypothetical protein